MDRFEKAEHSEHPLDHKMEPEGSIQIKPREFVIREVPEPEMESNLDG